MAGVLEIVMGIDVVLFTLLLAVIPGVFIVWKHNEVTGEHRKLCWILDMTTPIKKIKLDPPSLCNSFCGSSNHESDRVQPLPVDETTYLPQDSHWDKATTWFIVLSVLNFGVVGFLVVQVGASTAAASYFSYCVFKHSAYRYASVWPAAYLVLANAVHCLGACFLLLRHARIPGERAPLGGRKQAVPLLVLGSILLGAALMKMSMDVHKVEQRETIGGMMNTVLIAGFASMIEIALALMFAEDLNRIKHCMNEALGNRETGYQRLHDTPDEAAIAFDGARVNAKQLYKEWFWYLHFNLFLSCMAIWTGIEAQFNPLGDGVLMAEMLDWAIPLMPMALVLVAVQISAATEFNTFISSLHDDLDKQVGCHPSVLLALFSGSCNLHICGIAFSSGWFKGVAATGMLSVCQAVMSAVHPDVAKQVEELVANATTIVANATTIE